MKGISEAGRGKPTLHSMYSIPHALIAGDYLFVLGFGLGGRYDAQIVERMARTSAGLATGELLQLEHIGDLATTPEDYYAIIDGKTAAPFATTCSCAAIIANASVSVVESLEVFGMEVGRAFQLVDEIESGRLLVVIMQVRKFVQSHLATHTRKNAIMAISGQLP